MTTPEEKRILQLLAKEWETNGPPGILDISDIVAALPLAPGDILGTLKNLFTRGLVDMNQLRTSAFLTPEGYDTAKGDEPQQSTKQRSSSRQKPGSTDR